VRFLRSGRFVDISRTVHAEFTAYRLGELERKGRGIAPVGTVDRTEQYSKRIIAYVIRRGFKSLSPASSHGGRRRPGGCRAQPNQPHIPVRNRLDQPIMRNATPRRALMALPGYAAVKWARGTGGCSTPPPHRIRTHSRTGQATGPPTRSGPTNPPLIDIHRRNRLDRQPVAQIPAGRADSVCGHPLKGPALTPTSADIVPASTPNPAHYRFLPPYAWMPKPRPRHPQTRLDRRSQTAQTTHRRTRHLDQPGPNRMTTAQTIQRVERARAQLHRCRDHRVSTEPGALQTSFPREEWAH
jgi:hypothetical protein